MVENMELYSDPDIRLFRTSRAKLYQKEMRLLLNALTSSLLQKRIFQDSFSSTGNAEDPFLCVNDLLLKLSKASKKMSRPFILTPN
jgi:hypothetical protein